MNWAHILHVSSVNLCPTEFCSVCICNEIDEIVGMALRYEANDHYYGLPTRNKNKTSTDICCVRRFLHILVENDLF
jgi:hypothetical protein